MRSVRAVITLPYRVYVCGARSSLSCRMSSSNGHDVVIDTSGLRKGRVTPPHLPGATPLYSFLRDVVGFAL